MGLVLGGIAAFYLVCAGAAAIADPTYAVVALLPGLILASAALLLVARMRSKSVAGTGGSQDAARAASDDAAPGIGIDRETPLGDTSEHSDAERVAKPGRRLDRAR
jgi:hypothetical protein